MTRNVKLTLTGVQYDDAEQETVTEFSCEAEYCRKGESHYIFYEETEAGTPVKCTLKLKGRQLELRKKGAFSSFMVFEPDKEYAAQYATPLGSLPLRIFTERLENVFAESEILCTAEYFLFSGEQRLSRNLITVKIIGCKG